jgi:fructokinase
MSGHTQLVLGLGEVLWDCFAGRRLPGGAPANVIYHLSRLGHRAVLCSRVGADADGQELAELLRGRGLDLSALQRDPELPTGRVTVDTSDPASPVFEIHENVAWDALEPEPELLRLAAEADAVCVGTLAQRAARSRETIRRCLDIAAERLIVYDVNLREPHFSRDCIEATLERASVAKLNDDEARLLAEMLDAPRDLPGFARAVIERYGCELVCITRGADGCLAVSADDVHDEPGVPVKVADAVGAGDAFTAGLISSLLRGRDTARAVRLANRLGGLVAARAGAMPDLGDELERLTSDASC